MSDGQPPDQTLGRRARKRQALHDKIESEALALFARDGYDGTTVADIAEAADVAERTVFLHFPSKEAIVFAGHEGFVARLEAALDGRSDGTSTVDALRDFVTSQDPAGAKARLCARVIAASAALRDRERARSVEFERVLAASIARDLAAAPEDLRPIVVAASVTSAFTSARNRHLNGRAAPLSHAETLEVLDLALAFLAGGLAALGKVEPPPFG